MTAIAEDDPRLVFVPEAEITTEPQHGIIECFKDCWWIIHPTKGLVIFKRFGQSSLQCNRDKRVTESLAARLYPWAEIRQIPLVFRRPNLGEYA